MGSGGRRLGALRDAGAYETLMAQVRPQLALQLPEQAPQNTVWGHDQFGRVVILARETYKERWAYFVEWPSSLPEAPYPDDAHIVGNDVLSERLGERPVYIEYPSGALDLLPVIPDRRLWLVPPFKWGHPGTGPNRLEDAIEYACCSDILDKAPRRYRPRYIGTEVSAEVGTWSGSYLRAARNTLERVIGKKPAAETLEIRIGQIRGWYAEAVVKELRPFWMDLPPPP